MPVLTNIKAATCVFQIRRLHFYELSIILGYTFIKSPKTKLMDIKKLFMGGIVGGILFFGLGYLIYGNLLAGFMHKNPGTATGVERAMEDIQFLYLAIGNLAMGFLLAYIFVKSNVNSLGNGLVTAAVVGALVSVGVDCVTYATTNVTSKTAMAADVAATTVMCAIVGAIVGMLMGMGKKAS
jgi:hypothetical protein